MPMSMMYWPDLASIVTLAPSTRWFQALSLGNTWPTGGTVPVVLPVVLVVPLVVEPVVLVVPLVVLPVDPVVPAVVEPLVWPLLPLEEVPLLDEPQPTQKASMTSEIRFIGG
jgi:hypothetical protein